MSKDLFDAYLQAAAQGAAVTTEIDRCLKQINERDKPQADARGAAFRALREGVTAYLKDKLRSMQWIVEHVLVTPQPNGHGGLCLEISVNIGRVDHTTVEIARFHARNTFTAWEPAAAMLDRLALTAKTYQAAMEVEQ